MEIIGNVKTVWPSDLPIFVRLSATDWADGGWNLDDSVELSLQLKSAGIDLIDVSTGGLVSYAKIPVGPAYQLPFASRIKKEIAPIIMMLPYALIHIHKPFPEAIGSMFAGLILGNLALKSRSIWFGVLLHMSIALSMDFLGLFNSGFFN